MKKYEFIKNGVDDYTLKYKDKEINFNSNVNIQKDLQDVPERARKKMILDLAKEGISIKDLSKEIKENGKTYYDNSNKDELEKVYIEEEQAKTFLNIIENLFGMDYIELLKELEIENEEDVSSFATELGYILSGQFPSGETAKSKENE